MKRKLQGLLVSLVEARFNIIDLVGLAFAFYATRQSLPLAVVIWAMWFVIARFASRAVTFRQEREFRNGRRWP